MTLLFRAIWTNPDHVAPAVLEDEFQGWCRSKGIDTDRIPFRGSEELPDKRIEVRRGDAEAGRVLRCRLIENNPNGETWTTTATALAPAGTEPPTYWVDLDLDDPLNKRVSMAAPRLVRQILALGGSARRGPVSLQAGHRVVLGDDQVPDLVALIFDPERDLPVVVFSPDTSVGPQTNDLRASKAAERLAGIASVFLVAPACIDSFNEHLPRSFRVHSGAARHYLPGVRFDDGADSLRHRWYLPRQFQRSPHRAGELIASNLASLQIWPPEPSAWASLRGLLTRPSEEEIAERAAGIATARQAQAGSGSSAEVTSLLTERDELISLLVIAETDRDEQIASLTKELGKTREQAKRFEDDWIDSISSEEASQGEILALTQTIRTLHLERRQVVSIEGDVSVDPALLQPPVGIVESVEFAREHLEHVVIHERAPRDLDEMEESPKYQTWAQGIWQGLLALQAYAEAVSLGEFASGFYQWCGSASGWSTTKLAMTESESVMSSERLKACRLLPIDPRVDPTGHIYMEAHLKIQQGGNHLIPRVYFHDDTKGSTARIHVGFIGPHGLMPNTKTN